jgi:hypothetical protein
MAITSRFAVTDAGSTRRRWLGVFGATKGREEGEVVADIVAAVYWFKVSLQLVRDLNVVSQQTFELGVGP